MNANNNTYSCVRTINQTHNFLYCEFTTGLITFYNLRIGKNIHAIIAIFLGSNCVHLDPFETQNRLSFLSPDERSYLHDTLEHLKGCRGRSCTIARHSAMGNAALQQQGHNLTQMQKRVALKRNPDTIGK